MVDFHKRILFSDEALFWLNNYVNKQNCCIWSEANPQVYVETPLHPEKLTVWCALWAGGILLQNDEGHNVTVNDDRYRAMIINFFIPELNNHDDQELSCDLTPLDYFLWGYVKSLVYADKPQTPNHLEDNIRHVIADIRPQMLEKSSKIGRPDWTTSEPAVAVGAGTAGSVLAGRLVEKDCVTVLLLEGGKSPSKVTDIPTTVRRFIQSDIDWNYSTGPQKHTGAGLVNRSAAWPSGKAIGGCSVTNDMLNVRGNKKNYDDWAADGASGWSYEEVLPYFKKLEDNTDEEYVENGYHGTGGPVTVSKPPYDSELKAAVLEAAKDKGYLIGDINGPDATGPSKGGHPKMPWLSTGRSRST
ncbi:glucose dehydrogenase [Trichonephila clavipes]|nr:glucose dehydrogenase [Trichonephila clavipes]